MKFLKEHSVFFILLLITACLRFWPLLLYQFTFDELSGLDRTQFSSFSELLEKGVKIDAHPAFVQILIYYLTQFFGYTTWIIKLPFLLFSLGAMSYAYAFGLRNFSKQAGLVSAAVFSFSLIFVFYAPIARMYISGVFFSTALLFYFFELFFQKQTSIKNYFLFALFAWLSSLNHHMNALFACTLCVSGLFFLNKESFKKYLITCVLVLLAYLPHLSITLYQLSVPGIGRENGGWLETSEFTVIFDFFKILFGTGRAYFVLILIILVSIIFKRKVNFSPKQFLLLLLFIINYLIIYLYSVYKSPIYQHSVMLFASVALIAGISSMIHFERLSVFYTALLLLCAGLIYKSYLKKDYFHQSVKTVYETQFERSVYYKKLYGDTQVYAIFCDADTLMKKIYFNKYDTQFECKISADSIISNMENVLYERTTAQGLETISAIRLFSEFVRDLKADYLVISSAMPLQQAIVKEYFPYLIENTQTQAVNLKVYSKRAEDKNREVKEDAILFASDVTQANEMLYSKTKDEIYNTGTFNLKIDSLSEFPLDAKMDLNRFLSKEGQVILVSAKLISEQKQNDMEVCISINTKDNNQNIAYTAKAYSDFVLQKDSVVNLYTEYFNGTKWKTSKDQSNFSAYVWNKNKQAATLKSFNICVIDYWPMKWQFWD